MQEPNRANCAFCDVEDGPVVVVDVLEALMRAAPAPLSSEDLLERVWDEHADPFTKTVYVTVSRLRRKLGAPEIISNVARVGYRINV